LPRGSLSHSSVAAAEDSLSRSSGAVRRLVPGLLPYLAPDA
jgi:hypothetical protein